MSLSQLHYVNKWPICHDNLTLIFWRSVLSKKIWIFGDADIYLRVPWFFIPCGRCQQICINKKKIFQKLYLMLNAKVYIVLVYYKKFWPIARNIYALNKNHLFLRFSQKNRSCYSCTRHFCSGKEKRIDRCLKKS